MIWLIVFIACLAVLVALNAYLDDSRRNYFLKLPFIFLAIWAAFQGAGYWGGVALLVAAILAYKLFRFLAGWPREVA